VRKIMDLAPSRDTIRMKGSVEIARKPTKKDPNPEVRVYKRTMPLFYRLKWPNMAVSVPGHYETACGGCDTIPTYDMLFEIIRSEHAAGHHVLFEGLLVAHDKKRTLQLWEHLGKDPALFQVVELTDTLDVCLESVEKRRASRAIPPKGEFNPDNTKRRYGEVIRSCEQLQEKGVPIHRYMRADAPDVIRHLLKIPPVDLDKHRFPYAEQVG
jgi:hypothetical protein